MATNCSLPVIKSLSDESNHAVSSLLKSAENGKKANLKRNRNDFDDSDDSKTQSPMKKRKISPIKPLNTTNDTFGFSSDDSDDDSKSNYPFSENEIEADDALNIDLFEANDQNNKNVDPYWDMMQSINNSKNGNTDFMDIDSNNDDDKNNDSKLNESLSIKIDVTEESMFNSSNISNKRDESKTKKKAKPQKKKYQKWQRDQGIECTQAHLALLVYRSRFRALLCTNYELQCRMLSILPLHFHPTAQNEIYSNITFQQLQSMVHWFLTHFSFNPHCKQFELRCKQSSNRIHCAIQQLINCIESNLKNLSISHLNLLFLALLWSLRIPARYVTVLRPMSHILTNNKIFDDDYTQIMAQRIKKFASTPCQCQKPLTQTYEDSDIEMISTPKSSTKQTIKKEKEHSGEPWIESDDEYLWQHRDDAVESLSNKFSRSKSAIRMRLECITSPKTSAYQRLHGSASLINANDKKKCVKRRESKATKTRKKKGSKNKNKIWSVEDDIYLWEYRDDPVDTLSQVLSRTNRGIRRRLETLRDPNSKQRERLIDNLPKKAAKKLQKKKKRTKNKQPIKRGNVSKKGKTSMIECIEVYVSDRGEWVHCLLDKGRIHIDLSENNLFQCDCEHNSERINFCVAIDQFGCIEDVTPRYAEIWSQSLKNRVMHNEFYQNMLSEWQVENERNSFQYGWQWMMQHKLWQNIIQKAKDQNIECIESEPIPKSEGLLRNHPLYVIEKFVKKYECIYPNDESAVIGKVRGNKVYSIKNLRDLHTKERWYKLGYVVKEDERMNPVKKVKTSHMSKSEEPLTDLFGQWQCVEYIAPKIGPKDALPTNSRGNIELWSDKHLPVGCVHIKLKGAVFAAKRMKIEYAKAMIGFDQRRCRSVPVFEGIVVHRQYEEELRRIIKEMDVKRKEREIEKEEKLMNGLWRQLVQGIMVQHQLRESAKEKEENRLIVTTKEYDEMMIEDL